MTASARKTRPKAKPKVYRVVVSYGASKVVNVRARSAEEAESYAIDKWDPTSETAVEDANAELAYPGAVPDLDATEEE